MKKILFILISIMIIISAVSFPTSVNAAVKIKNKTLYMYTEGVSLDGGNGNHAYKYSVKNKKYIKVDFDGGEVGGIGYQLTVSARKITGKKKPKKIENRHTVISQPSFVILIGWTSY